MKYVLLVLILLSCTVLVAQKKQMKRISFLHTAGQDIVNEAGDKVFLKGVVCPTNRTLLSDNLQHIHRFTY